VEGSGKLLKRGRKRHKRDSEKNKRHTLKTKIISRRSILYYKKK
jgi:hypothetical protein